MSVNKNIIANFAGSVWSALMGLAFVPLYIKYLGIEAYGLIGVFVMLQAWMVILDLGLTPTLGREMARFKAEVHGLQDIHNLVRSMEWIFTSVAVTIALGVATAASWLSNNWLHAEHLPLPVVTGALVIIGFVIAVRWMSGLYRSALMGLQLQVWLSICTAIFSTLRGLGVIAVLIWISPTIQAFFIYQGLVSAMEALVLAMKLKRVLPSPPAPARFSWTALNSVWRFAAGMTISTLLALLLTQIDKVLLSNFLSLSMFGYYMLASAVAGALYMLVVPVSNAATPRLSELVARNEVPVLVSEYHKFSQLITLLLVPAAVVLAAFSGHVVLLWTGNRETTDFVAPLVSLLAIGTMLNGLMYIPSALTMAYGWARIGVYVNAVSVLILLPALYFLVPEYGAIAAAVIWVVLNTGYVILVIPFMHRRLLPAEMWRWYRQDVFVPMFMVLAAIGLLRAVSPAPESVSVPANFLIVMLAGVVAVAVAVLAVPIGRKQLGQFFPVGQR
jgi:O-antigen/teichoic acid export membrane protein